jgi:hypothetical protein
MKRRIRSKLPHFGRKVAIPIDERYGKTVREEPLADLSSEKPFAANGLQQHKHSRGCH